jgi:hypothetical protein
LGQTNFFGSISIMLQLQKLTFSETGGHVFIQAALLVPANCCPV